MCWGPLVKVGGWYTHKKKTGAAVMNLISRLICQLWKRFLWACDPGRKAGEESFISHQCNEWRLVHHQNQLWKPACSVGKCSSCYTVVPTVGATTSMKFPQVISHFLMEVVITLLMLCAEPRAVTYLNCVPEQLTTLRDEWYENPKLNL